MLSTSQAKPRMGALRRAVVSLEDMSPKEALASLRARVQAGRVHEHHVWEAVRILAEIGQLSSDFKHSSELRSLMQRDALREAALLMVQVSIPARSIECLTRIEGDWVCILKRHDGFESFCKAAHNDPVAAILAALLDSAYQSMVSAAGPLSENAAGGTADE